MNLGLVTFFVDFRRFPVDFLLPSRYKSKILFETNVLCCLGAV